MSTSLRFHWARSAARRCCLGAGLAAALLASNAASAETIAPEEGLQATLGAMNVSVYYEPTPSGYQVVTTVSTDQPGSVVRFVSTLSPGQETLLSVPRGVGQPAIELHLHRIGDRLELLRPVS